MAIDKTHACHATIVSAVALYQRAMLIVSLDPSGANILCKPGGTGGVCNFGSICMCVQEGFFMYRKEYPTEEELSATFFLEAMEFVALMFSSLTLNVCWFLHFVG